MPIYLGNVPLKPFRGEYKPANIYVGDKKIAGWVPEVKSGESVSFERTYNDTADVVIHGESVQDGEPAPDAPVDVVSAGDGDLVSRGKNLFDGTYIADKWINVNGDIVGSPGSKITTPIKIKPATQYTISGGNRSGVRWTDINGDKISGEYNSAAVRTVTAPLNAYYLQVHYTNTGEHTNIMIEAGSEATNYEPFHRHETALPPLRKIGDVADSYNPATGELVQRIGVKVFDGTETWVSVGLNTADTHLYFYQSKQRWPSANNTPGFCSHLSWYHDIGYGFRNRNFEYASGYPDSSASIILMMGTERFETLDWPGVSTYLAAQYAAGTPVTVYYQLAEPAITYLDPATVPTYYPTTVIEQDGAVKGTIEATVKVME